MQLDNNEELVSQEDSSVMGSQHSSRFIVSISYEKPGGIHDFRTGILGISSGNR